MTVSLKQLALLLGLSQTTVSRALNGYPEVSERTRSRVIDAARHHGYLPDPRARSLATGRAMAIGHVICAAPGSGFADPAMGDFLAGAGAVQSRRGYALHLSFADPAQEADHYRWLARRHAVDAVVIHAPRRADPRPAILAGLGLVFGQFGRDDRPAAGYDRVGPDHRAAAERATLHLAMLGHRRIALLNGPAELCDTRAREAGYLAAMAARGLAPAREWALPGGLTEPSGHAAARRLCAAAARPTALVAGSMPVALGALRAILEAGLRVPGDISLLAHDDALTTFPNGDPPRLTVTRTSAQEAGRVLAGLLIDRIEDPARPPQDVALAPDLVEGGSCGPVPAP
ncbi:LacI family DNA-binding transcriptional regulator [Mangrovicoccus algicola]|uniref:LacI family DNA-binding transcriptional regulator n=1 Tax=Mangrovicoccus algicola TaxID=2771008 RepID=A0A8J6YWV2_9RHOB|nr:LacI family DNA-binding transcriptional regulator [Mangrovicoccus algicola]MBE3639082.1 LacI family DNA-binding transcriptional regulator [Mangrovicoccus algicola]